MPHVLVIDDDPKARAAVSAMLEGEGFRVTAALEGPKGYDLAVAIRPDLIVVELCVHGLPGIEICQRLRAAGITVPILALCAKGGAAGRAFPLEAGADDCIEKPFEKRELLARVRALLRRAAPEAPRVLRFGGNQVDLERRIVTRGRHELRLTPAEYNLLVYFLQNPDRVLSRGDILAAVWGYDSSPNTRTVDAHVLKLRRKFGSGLQRHFLTVHGVGYRFLP